MLAVGRQVAMKPKTTLRIAGLLAILAPGCMVIRHYYPSKWLLYAAVTFVNLAFLLVIYGSLQKDK